jgi:hypothetical protein
VVANETTTLVLQEMKGEERMVCHFYRSSHPCQVMDKHLAVLAAKHLETKFVRLHAEKAPFLTGRRQCTRYMQRDVGCLSAAGRWGLPLGLDSLPSCWLCALARSWLRPAAILLQVAAHPAS